MPPGRPLVAWIKIIPPEQAEGPLAEVYESAVRRAGKVFHILRIQSLNPAVLRASIEMYLHVMFGPSPLSRTHREMIATVVSRVNDCHY